MTYVIQKSVLLSIFGPNFEQVIQKFAWKDAPEPILSKKIICGTSFYDAASWAAECDLALRDWEWCEVCQHIAEEGP